MLELSIFCELPLEIKNFNHVKIMMECQWLYIIIILLENLPFASAVSRSRFRTQIHVQGHSQQDFFSGGGGRVRVKIFYLTRKF
jgi:hypothetical protein